MDPWTAPSTAGPVADRIAIWPMDDGRYGLDATFQGSTGSKPRLTDHPVDVGHRSEAAILSQLVRRGYRVLLPFGVNQRYDMVLDNGGKLLKVQGRTGRLKEGAIRFSAQSVQSNTKGTRTRA